MLKNVTLLRVLAIALGSAAMWSIFVAISVSNNAKDDGTAHRHSPYHKHTPADVSSAMLTSVAGDEKHTTNYYHQYEEKGGIDPNWIIAFLTIILAVYTIRSADSAKQNADAALMSARAATDAVSLAGITAEKQLRAYVSFEIVHVEPIGVGEMVRFFFKPINHGQTPALDFAFRGYTRCYEASDATAEKLPVITGEWNSGRMVVFPLNRGDTAAQLTSDTHFFPLKTDIENIGIGSHVLVTALELRYTDFFQKERITQSIMILHQFWKPPLYHGKPPTLETKISYIPGTHRMT